MSRLQPSLMVLDKGLNLQAPKILAPEGSVLDSLNYEQVDFQGQKRIDGYVRYDGRTLSSFDDFVLVSVVNVDSNDIAYNDEGVAFGVAVGEVDGDTAIVVFNETELPATAQWASDVITDYEEHYQYVLQFASVLRLQVETLPGPIAGLHWFRDRLYAVADVRILMVPGNVDVRPNDLIEDAGDPPNQYVVLGRYFNGTDTYITVNALSTLSFFRVVRTDEEFEDVVNMAGGTASFYESRTEQQVLDEDGPSGPYDFGWKFNHLGWRVPFVEGNSPFGSLTSLNQNRQGVGVQGPTSIAGSNGKALLLVQKVNITNLPAQVNGWKTSTSNNVYNLEASALDDIDNETIYADAYFSWDGTTGEVVAPGITGEALIEYPATNTVVVDV